MHSFFKPKLIAMVCASGLIGVSAQAMASAFQLWEQDGASIGNYHAGYAALANDASTAWYNPAGITRIKNQQLVVGVSAINTNFEYNGNVTVTEFNVPTTFNGVRAQGGNLSFVPSLHYIAPINDWIGFGFSTAVPFGLKTDYGHRTPLRYAATRTSISVVDVSPSLGFQLTDKFSAGIGFDAQKVEAEFNSVGTFFGLRASDTRSYNKASGTGYGFHLGTLYQFTPDSRVGLSYHSQVRHHLTGSSQFVGPLSPNEDGSPYVSHAYTNVKLPAYTALSGYHKFNPKWALMSSLIYTQWNTFTTLSLHGVAGLDGNGQPSKDITVTVPENYRNTWNLSVGADYYATDAVTLRGAVGFDQTPVNDRNRNVQLPDNNRYVIALGGHYQATKTVGFDLGWSHLFMKRSHINPPEQILGAQGVMTNGYVNGRGDVFSGQVTWDIV